MNNCLASLFIPLVVVMVSIQASIILGKDVLSARDKREWASIAAIQALSNEGAIVGAVVSKKKKPLDLEEELRRVKIDELEYKPVPQAQRSVGASELAGALEYCMLSRVAVEMLLSVRETKRGN